MDYRFNLEALRQYRTYQEEACQKEMAEAQRIRNQEASLLEDLFALRDKTENDLKNMQQKRITGPQLAIYNNYLDQVASDIFAQKFKLSNAQKEFEKKRDALLDAMQQRKTLDKLKEKGLKAHLEQLSHEENKFINEMAISRHAAKQR